MVKRKKILNLLLKVTLVYVVLTAFLYFNQRNMIYHPNPETPIAQNFGLGDYETVSIETSDDLDLNGWFIEGSGQKVVLFLHGNVGHYGHRVAKTVPYMRSNYNVLLAGYRGYGGNPGNLSEQGLYIDARSYMDWLIREKGFSSDEIILHGESLGTGVAVQIATEYDVGAVILEAPYTSLPDVAARTYFFVPVHLLMKDRFNSHQKIEDINAPLLIVHGTKDKVIPIEFGKRLFEKAREPKKFVELSQASHNDLPQHNLVKHALDFLEINLP